MGILKRILALLLLGFVVSACVSDSSPQYTRDGVQYGATEGVFRGRWWSYYERGASFLAGDYLNEAVSDLQQALRGNSRDSWRARTYGLHFVEYFPNREIGIAYLKSGQVELAEEYLMRSLQNVDTDRAHFYLDQVKKEKIARGIISDDAEPGLRTSLSGVTFLAERAINLQVDAEDDVGVYQLAVNGRPIHLRGSGEQVAHEEPWLLDEGEHEFHVEATDLADKAVTETVSVTVDLTGPTIGIMAPAEGLVTQAASVTLEAAAVDRNGVVLVKVGEETLAEESAGTPRVEIQHELPLNAGENRFVILAKDVAGNETRTVVSVFRGSAQSAEAQHWQLRQRHPGGLKLAAAELLPELLLSATAEGSSGITVKSPRPDRPSRHNRTLKISGEVVASAKVTALTINGESLDPLAGAPKESFNKSLPVDVGEDGVETIAIAILAEDEAGGKYDESFSVEVRPVALETLDSKMPIAVLAFAALGELPGDVAALLRTTTEQQLSNQGRFHVLDRVRLLDVLQEQELASALSNPDEALRLGKLVPAFAFLVAEVYAREQNGVEIKARVINTETSTLMKTLDVFIQNRDDRQAVESGCASLAEQLKLLFPRLSGEVMGSRDAGGKSEVLVNWTKDDGIQQGVYLLMLQESEPWIDPDTGEVLEPGALEEVGRARVVDITASSTRAQTIERKQEDVALERGMPAISM